MEKLNRDDEDKKIELWFEIEQIGGGIFVIGEPYHREEVFCYFIEERDKDLLIDTGMGVVPITKALEKIRNSNKELVAVNSHAHFDHIGGNYQLDNILVPDNDWEINIIRKGWNHSSLERYGFSKEFKKKPIGFIADTFEIPGYEKILPVLKEGFIIDLGDRKIEVLETPGHTPGGVCFFDRSNEKLFTSDLLYQGPLFCFENESSIEDYYSSLVKLREMKNNIKQIHPGHNYYVAQPTLIDSALECFDRIISHLKPDYEEKFNDQTLFVYSHPSVESLSVLVNSKG